MPNTQIRFVRRAECATLLALLLGSLAACSTDGSGGLSNTAGSTTNAGAGTGGSAQTQAGSGNSSGGGAGGISAAGSGQGGSVITQTGGTGGSPVAAGGTPANGGSAGQTGSAGNGAAGSGTAGNGSAGQGGSAGQAGNAGTGGGNGGAGNDAPVTFAVVGDFGADNEREGSVADLIKGWNPAFIVTLGDNNYDGAGTIDTDVGKYYAPYIGSYHGSHGTGSTTPRFYPATGNHDWDANNLKDYLAYFTLPGIERYYEQRLGLVHLFAVDSDDREPDGITQTSKQAMWLKGALAKSDACYKLVYFHHAPYTSGTENGPTTELRWPFETWGASVVLTGHEHVYERLKVGGIWYLVNGLGGDSPYDFGKSVPESVARFDTTGGAMKVTATRQNITYEFWAETGDKIDSVTVPAQCK